MSNARVLVKSNQGVTLLDISVSHTKFTISQLPLGENYTIEVFTDLRMAKANFNVTAENQLINLVLSQDGLNIDTSFEPSTQKKSIVGFNPSLKKNLKTDFGAKGDGITDDFEALKNALLASVNEPLELTIPSGVYRYQGPENARMETWPAKSKGLKIIGQGAVLKPVHNRTSTVYTHYAGQIVLELGSKFEMRGVTIDGGLNPLDFYKTMGTGSNMSTLIPMTRGLTVDGATEVVVTDCNINNLYGGYGLLFENYEKIDLTDITMDKCGGNSWTESFGMALYFSGHTSDEAVVNIDNVHAKGITDPGIPKQAGWVGVVLENGTIQNADQTGWLRDKNTEINITNSSFMDYETTYHAESLAGNVYWNSDNVKARSSTYMIYSGIWGEFKERSNLMDIELMPFGRSSILHGLYYSENENTKNVSGLNDVNMYNSDITYVPVTGCNDPEQILAYANGVRAKINNSTVNNIPKRLVSNAGATLNNVELNLKSSNPNTDYQLLSNHEGYFNNDYANQKIITTSTNINREPNWKTAPETGTPGRVKNTGYIAPWLDKPISAATLERES